MTILKTLIVYSLAILSIIFLYFIYQTKEIKNRENRPIYYNFKDFDVVCPDDYYYVGSEGSNDKCRNFINDSDEITFPTLLDNGDLDLSDIENMVRDPKIKSRCDSTKTFSALKPFCTNE